MNGWTMSWNILMGRLINQKVFGIGWWNVYNHKMAEQLKDMRLKWWNDHWKMMKWWKIMLRMLGENRNPKLYVEDSIHIVIVVQSLSRVQLFVTPWTEALQAPLSFTDSWSLLKLVSVEWVMSSNHLVLCCPLLLLPLIHMIGIKNTKYWSGDSQGH